MAEKAIPPNLEPAILEKAGEGWSSRRIAAWLLESHGVDASHGSVGRLLRAVRTERAEVTKSVVREKLGATVLSDIDRLEKHAAKLDEMADRAAAVAEADPDAMVAYVKVVEQLRKVTDTKLHYSGADTPDDGVTEAQRRIAGRMAQLAARRGAAAGVSEPGPDPGGVASP